MTNLKDSRVLITGAAGGIGSATARALGHAGAKLLLTDIEAPPLRELEHELGREGIDTQALAVNLANAEDRVELVGLAARERINTLINVAGVNPFGWLTEQTPADIELVLRVNTVAPMLLCQAMLPLLEANAPAHIVNVGSAFGAIGYPGFAAYSASKFAIRGFSEALRRELAGTGIGVHYVAPRATRTRLVTDRVRAMNEALGIAMDAPEVVGRTIATALRSGRRELAVGFAERCFAKINALLPALIDRALARQLPTIRSFAAKDGPPDHTVRSTVPVNPNLQERTQ